MSEASDSKAVKLAAAPSWASTGPRLGPFGKPPSIERLSRWVSRSFVGSKAFAETGTAAASAPAASAATGGRREGFTLNVVGGAALRLIAEGTIWPRAFAVEPGQEAATARAAS